MNIYFLIYFDRVRDIWLSTRNWELIVGHVRATLRYAEPKLSYEIFRQTGLKIII